MTSTVRFPLPAMIFPFTFRSANVPDRFISSPRFVKCGAIPAEGTAFDPLCLKKLGGYTV